VDSANGDMLGPSATLNGEHVMFVPQLSAARTGIEIPTSCAASCGQMFLRTPEGLGVALINFTPGD
jgi:hypothetical protein